MFTEIICLALVAAVACNDITIGNNTNGRKIFDETKKANPAIWRQTDNVTITADNGEVIDRIIVKDLRPEKDGDAQIVDGGEGQKDVTIELKSPTALRGYAFKIEVYSVPDMKDLKEMHVNASDDAKPTDTNFNRQARNLVDETTTVMTEDFVTVDFSKENAKISKDAQDHETVDFILNDSVKEDLKIEMSNENDVTSTTEHEESTHFESMSDDKYEKMNDDTYSTSFESTSGDKYNSTFIERTRESTPFEVTNDGTYESTTFEVTNDDKYNCTSFESTNDDTYKSTPSESIKDDECKSSLSESTNDDKYESTTEDNKFDKIEPMRYKWNLQSEIKINQNDKSKLSGL